MNTFSWLQSTTRVLGALALLSSTATTAVALDCWVPTREQNSSVNINVRPMVKLDPAFGWDTWDANRVQLISVSFSYIPADEVVERREAMRKTRESFDDGGLAALLR